MNFAKVLQDPIAPKAPTSHWCLHAEATCKAKEMQSISSKPALVKDMSIHVEDLEMEK